jgi:hypothetical protein
MTTKKPANKKATKKTAPQKKPAAKKASAKTPATSTPKAEANSSTVAAPVNDTGFVVYAGDIKNPKTKRRFLNWFKF